MLSHIEFFYLLAAVIRCGLIFIAIFVFAGKASAQIDEICGEAGIMPSLDSPFAHVPYVYGKVNLKGFDSSAKLPKVTIFLIEGQQRERWTIDKSGNYCFKRKSNGGGTLIIEVNGIEAAQRTLPAFGPPQQREDFEIYASESEKPQPPGVVSAKFSHPVNPKTVELYKKTAETEKDGKKKKVIENLKEIVSIDPADFIAWAKLGSLYFEQNSLPEAEAAFRKSLELKVEYTPAWIFMGKIRMAQTQFDAAVEIFKHATTLEPDSARTFQLLGEAYLQTRKGTLGAEALNQALKLDPIGMAECHLYLARLYDLAGAKNLAAREYKLFLTKVPDYPEKKKLEKYIKDNPEK
jgi:Tfp pilus assembly protein PilF